ncbi:hypothetical protein FPZ24_02055 [Sphingomonas panacisoli]|uniref:Uncharacterized protein n=1 Tax=Sphingomonas panacisoli TaxID=1813879 RepID=A0A5B8LE56_9SPHN|nr:hypothetical protein [Sphingomonas panacisoli]QDZ06407.1 hypothetical protein FPZ24_02055 [Sphingomonas panacisoli]
MAGNWETQRDRVWSGQPVAEAVLTQWLADILAECTAAQTFAETLLDSCAVRLRDIIDHIDTDEYNTINRFVEAGWIELNAGVFVNPDGNFPPLIRGTAGQTIHVRVESVEQFAKIYGLTSPIEGKAHGPARLIRAFDGAHTCFAAYERNGHEGFGIPDVDDADIRSARLHLQTFRSRRRQFDRIEDGLEYTEALVDSAVAAIGKHWACSLWLKSEVEYWMLRCAAGRMQKARQDKVGIGWANIDHHTYDGSRRHFRHTIRIFEKLGYERREMLYAGELSGWGSQVLEQPTTGSTIFADVDLAPDELQVDFAQASLPELSKTYRAGTVSALHGESILEAGLNHIAGLYDQQKLRLQLHDLGFGMMSPFSDTSLLYQELTLGDWVAVDPARVDALEAIGNLGTEEAERIRTSGAILTHFENIQRNEGYKGFNKPGIDRVLRKLDPRAYHEATLSAEAAR